MADRTPKKPTGKPGEGERDIKLAHHFHHEGTDYVPGDTIRVPDRDAAALVAAGYAAVDPEAEPELADGAVRTAGRRGAAAQPS